MVSPSSLASNGSVLEQSQYKYDFSCVLLPFEDGLRDDFLRASREFVDYRDLTENGLEQNPHLTLIYGLESNEPREVQETLRDFGWLKYTLFFVSVFWGEENGKEYDVLKLDILDADKRLAQANSLLRQLPNKSDYPVYKPHVTIAYVKRGQGYKYLGKPFSLSFQEINVREAVFSDRDGEKHSILLAD